MIRHPAYAGTWKYAVVFLMLLIGVLQIPPSVHASIPCTFSFDTTEFAAGQQGSAVMTLNNGDSESHIQWVRITRPSEQYVFNEVGSSWTISPTEYDASTASVQLTDGDVGPGIDLSTTLTFTAGTATGVEYWVVYVSENADGSSPVGCSGSSGTSITGNTPTPISTVTPTPTTAPGTTATSTPTTAPGTTATLTPTTAPGTTATSTPTPTPIPDTSPPVISVNRLSASTFNKAPQIQGTASDDQAVTNISYSINTGKTWNTVPIKSGKTVQYAFLPTLSGDGLYSLLVRARDAAGNSIVGEALAFTLDTTLPTLALDTDLKKPLKIPPHLIGIASDESGIVKIEGSVDGGANWLQAQPFDKSSSKRVFFDIPLPTLDDGNYHVQTRTQDSAGNIYVSADQIMVIDRLPPRIGSVVLLLGPHVLEPKGEGGSYELSEHTKVKLVAQAVGGPTELVLSAVSHTTNQTLKFPFEKNADTGLWTTIVEVPDHGMYTISIHAIDGAGNTGDATIGGWDVKDPGIVETQNHTPIAGARMQIFVYDADTKTFLPWDAESFGGVNPQQTGDDGTYHVLLPPGTYYLTIEKNGYRRIRTSIMTLVEPTAVSQSFTMSKGYVFSFGSFVFTLPSFLSPFEEVKIAGSVSIRNVIQTSIGKKMPQSLLDAGNQKGQSLPTHVVFVPIFHPQLAAQLQVLDGLAKINTSWQTVVVLTQASTAEAGVLIRQGNYTIPIVGDPDGELTNTLGIWSTPMHYLVGQDGTITGQIVGLLLEQEIVDNRIRYSHVTKNTE
jgi:hypothetical protein